MLEGYADFDSMTEVLEMLRCGFGLKDAPRLWQKVRTQTLKKLGCVPQKADPQLFMTHERGVLTLVLSCHVDDLKGGDTEEMEKRILDGLTQAFGELKVQRGEFELVGVMHEQDPKTKEIYTHQRHYIKQLKEIDESRVSSGTRLGRARPVSIAGRRFGVAGHLHSGHRRVRRVSTAPGVVTERGTLAQRQPSIALAAQEH